MNIFFGTLFILTGIFAIIGGLYTWGDGSIFSQNELINVMIPWADILLTGPLSLLAGFGLLKDRHWGIILSLSVSGIYIFGSLLVFISIYWNDNYSILLIIPAIIGLLIGLGFIAQNLKQERL